MRTGREYLDEKRLAKNLGLSVKTLQQWRWKGIGPPYLKLGGWSVRYDPDAVDRWATTDAKGDCQAPDASRRKPTN